MYIARQGFYKLAYPYKIANRMRGPVKHLLSRPSKSKLPSHLALGERGEQAALNYLKEQAGYSIVAQNFLVPLGRSLGGRKLTAEIDIIAYDEQTLVFIEVKTRTSDEIFAPERAVDLRKQRQIARAARRYRLLMNVADERYRYDVVTVIPGTKGDRIELLRAYFDDSVFHRSRFFDANRYYGG